MEKKFEKDSMLYKIVEYIFLEAEQTELDIIIDAASKKKQEGDNFNIDQATKPVQNNKDNSTSYIPPGKGTGNINDLKNILDSGKAGKENLKQDSQGSPEDPNVQLNPNEFAKKILSDMKSGSLADKKKSKIPEFADNLSQKNQEKYLPPLPEDHIQYLIHEFSTKPSLANSGLLLFCTAAFLEFNSGSMNNSLQSQMDKLLPNWPEKFWNFFNSKLQNDLNKFISSGQNAKEILQNIKNYCE